MFTRAGRLVLGALGSAGGMAELSAAHEAVSAHHGNNHLPLVERFYRSSRSALFDVLELLVLTPTSADHSVAKAVRFLAGMRTRTGEHIPNHADGVEVDLTFASEAWRRIIVDHRRPNRLVRRHFEACVFTYLAAELRCGDIAVAGSSSYADFTEQLLSWAECEPLIGAYCAEAGIPADAEAACAALRDKLDTLAARVDAGYPDNADLVIEGGRPLLKRRKGKERGPAALKLETAVQARMPERGILDILTRTGYWIGWPRHFGPASGSDPKIRDAFARYVLLTFTYGANLGPAQVARHMPDKVSAHELSTANKHTDANKIHAASVDVVNAHARLDLTRLWGDGSRVGVDGTQLDTWADNLLAESSIRYGGYGGIAYRYIADNYIALFSHFIPCGVWEAVYLLEGLLANTSDVQPRTVHADTQGQSLPVFGLAHLLGFDLLPRIRNWQDLILYRPAKTARYAHIDALFGAEAVDWKLIATHWGDLMRLVLSIRAGRISSATLLRRLGNESRRNRTYRALRELGRAVRSIVLLRYLSEPELREAITAVTNRVEAFHGFASWLSFGHDGVLADNDPDHHEKIVKFNELLANCAIYSTTLDITAAANELAAEGWAIDPEDLATITPYITSKIRRFGDWVLNLDPPPSVVGGRLDLATLR